MNEPILGLETAKVQQVLLSDGWHLVKSGSFEVGNLAFAEAQKIVGPTGDDVPAVQWMERDDSVVTCPLSAVLAIKST